MVSCTIYRRFPYITCAKLNIGTGQNVDEIETLTAIDPQVYFAATLLWKMLTSGIYDLEEYG